MLSTGVQGLPMLMSCNNMSTFVNNHYGQGTVIVFDGYGNGPSIKDQEHQWRVVSSQVVYVIKINRHSWKMRKTKVLS